MRLLRVIGVVGFLNFDTNLNKCMFKFSFEGIIVYWGPGMVW